MKFHRVIKAFIFVSLFVSVSHGQWKMLKDFGAEVYTVHFLDREGFSNIGFAGLINGHVWRTSDGGVTWKASVTPPDLLGSIRNFTFKDSLNGWLVQFLLNGSSPACYMTT